MQARVRHLGLTGGIGSGKSTVAQAFVACGAWLVDADAIARGLTLPGGAAIPALAHVFGPQAIDAAGALDRAYMRTLAFSDPLAKAQLEAVLHPLIGQACTAQAAQGEAAGAALVVFDVPLLTESRHWRERVDRVLVVDCSEATQLERVARRPGWSAHSAQAVMAQQASRTRRRAIADAVIFNDGLALAQLQDEVRALWAHWVPSGRQAPKSAPAANG